MTRGFALASQICIATLCGVLAGAGAEGATLVSQTPPTGGGVSRWSQLWQDPTPAGNDLDSDAVCWEDFTLGAPTTITHVEWWGTGACELGFQIEIWPQDPNTIAYQPLGAFYYGGVPTVTPTYFEWVTTHTVTPGPGGINHYAIDLPVPITLAANNTANPRWFIGIVGLTHVAFASWNWSQGLGGSSRTYQFVRGSTADYMFRVLPEGRALVLADASLPPCPGDTNGDRVVNFTDLNRVLSEFGQTGVGLAGDLNGDGSVTFLDLNIVLSFFGVVC